MNLRDQDEKPILLENEQCSYDGEDSCKKSDDNDEIQYVANLKLSISIPSSAFKRKPCNKDRHRTVECTQCNRKMKSHHLKRHLQRRDHNSDENIESKKIKIDDAFQFSSWITGYYNYRHRWTPYIDEVLNCEHEEDNNYDEYAIAVMKDGMIVGHVPKTISKQFYNLLKSGGFVKTKVIGNPANTKKLRIRIPCMYIVSGQESYIQDIKNNFVCIL